MKASSVLEKKVKKIFWIFAGLGLSAPLRKPFHFRSGLSVLAFRPDRLGDFILTAPALQALEKRLGPTGRLTLVSGERNEAIARFFFPRAEIWVARRNILSRLGLWIRLGLGRFDLAVDFHSYPFSTTTALMTILSGAPARVGFRAVGGYEQISERIYNVWTPPPREEIHEMEKGFLLLEPLIGKAAKGTRIPLRIPEIPLVTRKKVRDFYRHCGVQDRHFILALHPTLLKADNRWSARNYLELIRRSAPLKRVALVVVHGKGEENSLRFFKESLPPHSNVFVLPENDILFILEAAQRFDLLVCNDSGLMHLGALAAPVLALFGPSDPRRWGPLSVGPFKPRVIRSKDHLCDSIQSGRVFKEVRKVIQASRQV